MIGVIGGAVASMVFVTYLIKIGKFSKKMKGGKSGSGQRSSPGSKSTAGEEEDEFNEDKFV